MTTITKDITAKFAVAAVAVAMIFSAYAPAAQAQTTEDLQQMINALLEQVAQLQAQVGGGDVSAPAGAPAVCPYTWTRDLTMGSEGADVMKLQQFLNANPDLRVAATGAGSAGMETMYYGPATAAAVSKMQVAFRAEVLTPNGLVNPTGYFGASSRAKANALCVADATTEEVDDATEEEEEEDDEASMTLSGEGILETFEIDDAEDDVQEGSEDQVVLEITAEAEDGDIELARLQMQLIADEDNDEVDPWDVFDEVSIWVDGDKVASFDASDEDDYLDEDEGTFRFSNLDIFLAEDEEVEILVAVSVQNSVDGLSASVDADWNIDVLSARTFDADGVADTATFGEMGSEDSAVQDGSGVFTGITDGIDFKVVEAGTDDGADLEGSSDNPDAATLMVDEDSDDSDEYVVHIFDIEVDRDSSDLELGDAFVDVTIANPNSVVIGGQRDVVDGIFMTINGVTEEGDAVSGAADLEGAAITANGGTTTVRYRFEFDQDVTLDGDEDYEVEVSMVFKGQDDNGTTAEYRNGVTVETFVDGSLWEVEGVENDNELSGIDRSEEHTLATVVPVISGTDFSVDRNEATTQGTISFQFTVEADGDNDVTLDVADNNDVDGASDDIRFRVTGGAATATGTLALVSGDATFSGGVWTINDGDDATFALDVAINGSAAAGTYRVNVDTIAGVEVDETSNGMTLVTS